MNASLKYNICIFTFCIGVWKLSKLSEPGQTKIQIRFSCERGNFFLIPCIISRSGMRDFILKITQHTCNIWIRILLVI